MQAASILLVISYISSCLAVGSAPDVLASAEHARDGEQVLLCLLLLLLPRSLPLLLDSVKPP
jgi:hypothetical protein